jgi:hypothetical protein
VIRATPPGQIATRGYELASANYDARVTGKRQPEQESEGEGE